MENEIELSPEQEEMIRRGAEETEKFLRDPRHCRYMDTDRNKERMIVMQKGLDLKPMPDKEPPKPDPFSSVGFQNGRPVKIGGKR